MFNSIQYPRKETNYYLYVPDPNDPNGANLWYGQGSAGSGPLNMAQEAYYDFCLGNTSPDVIDVDVAVVCHSCAYIHEIVTDSW